jgi:16S rRNA (guanine527-N7)-methyltransferase
VRSDLKFSQLQSVLPDVSRETFERLLAYEALFLKWSKAFNLAAPSTLNDFWLRHVIDCAQLAAIRKPSGVWLDLGSGGGLPGVVMSILMRESDGGIVHLIESNGKKAAFLRNAILETGGAGKVLQIRIEDAALEFQKAEVITARALANLNELLRLSQPWLNAGATALFHKGREFREEIKLARDGWQFDLIEHPSVADPASAILEIRTEAARTERESRAIKDI